MEDVKKLVDHAVDSMNKAVEHLENELAKIRAGKASPQMLDSVYVDYYGTNTPINQVGSVNTTDARTLVVQPWEKSLLTAIEKAIQAANLGLNPQNDGTVIRIAVPPLTEERRKDLVKKAKSEGEHCKVTIRTARRDANEGLKKLLKAGLPEDMEKEAETRVQHLTDSFIVKVDKHLEIKEKEIMTV